MAKKKRSRSVFDAVQELEQEDAKAEGERRTASKRDVQKSRAAQSQTKIYGSLVECRILLQRSMTASLKKQKTEAVGECDALLSQLLQARQKLLQKEHEDIPEATDSKRLQSDYESCREEWKHVLNRRHRSVQLHAPTKFGGIDSFWQQVESTVQHEQLRRKDDQEFDDTKIYQHLLKDFVATSQTDAEVTAQQRLRSKTKSKKEHPDRRASKGRKIRYTPVPKLANFCFPQSRPVSNALDEDEWFRSLFGGAGKIN